MRGRSGWMTSSGGLSFLDKGLERSSLGAQEQDPSSMEATCKLSLSSAPWHSHTGPKTAAALSEMPDFSLFGPALPSAWPGGLHLQLCQAGGFSSPGAQCTCLLSRDFLCLYLSIPLSSLLFVALSSSSRFTVCLPRRAPVWLLGQICLEQWLTHNACLFNKCLVN